MAIAFVQVTSGTDLTPAEPAGCQADHVLLAIANCEDNATAVVTPATGWVQVPGLFDEGTGTGQQLMSGVYWIRRGGSAVANNWAISAGGGARTVSVVAYSGVRVSGDPWNGTPVLTLGSDTTAEYGSLTSTVDGCMLVALQSVYAWAAAAGSGSWVERLDQGGATGPAAIYELLQTTAGASAALTVTGPTSWVAHLLALEPYVVPVGFVDQEDDFELLQEDGTSFLILESGSGSSGVTGTLATTLAGATLAASGTETISGTLASTLAGVTLAVSGTVANPVTGTLATTLAGATLAASGTEMSTGTLATTLDDSTLAGAATETFTGTFAATLAGATLAASGTVANPVSGTLASTLAGATLAASGAVGSDITGTLVSTLGGATLAASGTETITGTSAVTLAGAALLASGVETFAGILATTLDAVTLAVTGLETFTGTLTVTVAGATFVASGTGGADVVDPNPIHIAFVEVARHVTTREAAPVTSREPSRHVTHQERP